jgi:cell division protein FtsZ
VQRTGTDNVGYQIPNLGGGVANGLGGTGVAQPDYDSLRGPAVWRTPNRTQASARVDALSSGGMDDYEIPAFLRKQAD